MRKSTKYLLSMGELKRKITHLFLKMNEYTYIPIESVREIYCLNEISLNSKLFHFLSNAGVIVHFFNYYQQYAGTFYPKEQLVSGKLTVMQAKLFETKRLDVAKSIVNGIAKNIHYVLYHYYKHGKTDLKPYLDWLKKEVPKLLKKKFQSNKYYLLKEKFGGIFMVLFTCFYLKVL